MIQIQSIKSKYQPIGQTMFTRFDKDDVIANNTEIVTSTVWSNSITSLTTHFSSSAQTNTQRQYYVDVANTLPGSSDSAIQYSIAYGDSRGSGSYSAGQLNDSPSRAIYSQMRQLLFPATSKFSFGATDSITGDYFYAITFKRNRMKERLNVGNLEIPLTSIQSRSTNATASVTFGSDKYTFIDDSSTNKTPYIGPMGRVYNLVSGSIVNGIFGTTPTYYGKVYPDYGIVIFDGKTLDVSASMLTTTGSGVENNNHFVMFRSISGSGAAGAGFAARNSEKLTSTQYFVRVKNTQYNYTTNPSIYNTSAAQAGQGAILTDFTTNPVTYITTIGLYNDDNQLLAVAKLSQPIQKTFSKEALIRVKLDF